VLQTIREAGDVGRPAVLQEESSAAFYMDEMVANFERELRLLPFRKKNEQAETV
jgi:hypothetical protein